MTNPTKTIQTLTPEQLDAVLARLDEFGDALEALAERQHGRGRIKDALEVEIGLQYVHHCQESLRRAYREETDCDDVADKAGVM